MKNKEKDSIPEKNQLFFSIKNKEIIFCSMHKEPREVRGE